MTQFKLFEMYPSSPCGKKIYCRRAETGSFLTKKDGAGLDEDTSDSRDGEKRLILHVCGN